MSKLEALIAVASGPLSTEPPWTPLEPALSGMLGNRNGFYAFESALHVFPSAVSATAQTLEGWNAPTGWRAAYGGLDDAMFFAEDIFGGQFAIKAGRVQTFDPETGQFEELAGDLEQWADALLRDYRVLTGYPLAHEWQLSNGQLDAGMRLVPLIPFILGGEYRVTNLRAELAEAAMKRRAALAQRVRDLPDGDVIEYRI